MSIALVFAQIGSFLLVFLIMLNGYLRGREKAKIDAVLSVLLVGTLAATFYWFGWRVGILTVAIYFGYSLVTKPLARRAAFGLLGYRTSLREERPLKSVEQLLGKANSKLQELEQRDADLFAQGKSFDEVMAQYKTPKP